MLLNKKKHKFLNNALYLVVLLLILATFFLRLYDFDRTFFFLNDQGEFLIETEKIWKYSQVVIKGTSTSAGVGIVTGPLFYYLITPAHALGDGNPLYPAIFLTLIASVSVYLLFRLATSLFGFAVAFLTLIFATFSYNLIVFSRWFSNPNPMLILSLFFMFCLYKTMNENKIKWWILSAFCCGASFSFEAASAFYYVIFFAFFILWQWKKIANKFITLFLISLTMLLMFSPMIFLDSQPGNDFFAQVYNYIFSNNVFGIPSRDLVVERFLFIEQFLISFTFPGNRQLTQLTVFIGFIYFLTNFRRLIQNDHLKLIILFLAIPTVGIFFFRDNIVDYYFSGFYYALFIIIGFFIYDIGKSKIGKIYAIFFTLFFLINNLQLTFHYFQNGSKETEHVNFLDQRRAINWLANSMKETHGSEVKKISLRIFTYDRFQDHRIDYNLGYRYLLSLHGISSGTRNTKCPPGGLRSTTYNGIYTYVLIEKDPTQSERFEEWYSCYGFNKRVTTKSATFGNITVEERKFISE